MVKLKSLKIIVIYTISDDFICDENIIYKYQDTNSKILYFKNLYFKMYVENKLNEIALY